MFYICSVHTKFITKKQMLFEQNEIWSIVDTFKPLFYKVLVCFRCFFNRVICYTLNLFVIIFSFCLSVGQHVALSYNINSKQRTIQQNFYTFLLSIFNHLVLQLKQSVSKYSLSKERYATQTIHSILSAPKHLLIAKHVRL